LGELIRGIPLDLFRFALQLRGDGVARAFLKKSLADRQQILAQQAETMIAHYQESNEWRELMAGDIIEDRNRP
jgi:hypothetical protein